MADANEELRALREQIRAARERVLSLILEREDVLLQQLPQVEADYQLKIGVYEKKLLEAELDCRRLKRKCALAQQAINQGLTATSTVLEAQLDREFASWQKKLNQMTQQYLASVGYWSLMDPMTAHQGRELKTLYRTLVKRLHPDTHPSQSQELQDLFMAACNAYRHGDIALLRSLEVATQELDQDSRSFEDSLDSVEDPDELEVMLVAAQAQVDVMEEELQKAMETPPMPLRDYLEDGAWVAKKVGGLNRQIRSFEEARDQYQGKFEVMRKAGYVC